MLFGMLHMLVGLCKDGECERFFFLGGVVFRLMRPACDIVIMRMKKRRINIMNGLSPFGRERVAKIKLRVYFFFPRNSRFKPLQEQGRQK